MHVSDPPHTAIVATTACGESLQIIVVPVDSTQSVVQLSGEVDLANAGLVAAALAHELAGGRRSITLDLSRVDFLDGAALRVLMHAHNDCLIARGALSLTGLSRQIVRLLRITRLDEALFVIDTLPETQLPRHLAAVRSHSSVETSDTELIDSASAAGQA